MTIKNQDKNISAESEYIITNIEDNPNGLLTVTLKNQWDESVTTKTIDLSKHKLQLVKLNSQNHLNLLKNGSLNDINNAFVGTYINAAFEDLDEVGIYRDSKIFLVGASSNDEGIYREYMWIDDDFEVIGSTDINLEPFFLKTNVYNALDYSTNDNVKSLSAYQGYVLNRDKIDKTSIVNNLTTSDANKVLSATQGKELKDITDTLQSTKVTVEQGKGLSEANFTNAEKTKLSNIQIVDTVADGNSGAVTSNAVYDTINGLNYIDGTDYEEVEVTVTYANNGGTDSLLILAKRSS